MICGIYKNDTNELIYKTESDNKPMASRGIKFGR